MKNNYETPEMIVIEFENEDIITTSGVDDEFTLGGDLLG